MTNRFEDPWGYKCGPLHQLVSCDGDGTQHCDEQNGGFNLTADSATIETIINEHIYIGGACLNVFKLLGIHEQGINVDLIGNGKPLSNGDSTAFEALQPFDVTLCNGWKSKQKGNGVLDSFIGYDFGPIKSCERTVYGIETNTHKHITSIWIQQGPEARNRSVRVRVERSNDGAKWYGVGILELADDDELHQYDLKPSVASRYWRIRPITFNGGDADRWHIMNIKLADYQRTNLSNLQDEFGYMESRDRDYDNESITMKGYYELLDTRTELSKFGIDMTNQPYYITVGFRDSIRFLGRPFVIGDIIELPNEVQYTPDLKPVKKFLEVTDVSWSIEGYTPGWRPTLQRLVAEPILATQETLDIIGDYRTTPDQFGFIDVNKENIQDFGDINEKINVAAADFTPELGSDVFEIAQIGEDVIEHYAELGIDAGKVNKTNYNPRALYVEDGLPKNGEPYTEGDKLPETGMKDGDFHRLTYSTVNGNIPPRLFKFSAAKNRWIFCETDRRSEYNRIKPSLQNALSSTTARPNDRISKKDYD